jgi:hypothetical protein
MHEQVDVVGLPVELAQFGIQLGAYAAHQLLAEGEHGVGEHRVPVFGDEHLVGVQVVDGASAAEHVGVQQSNLRCVRVGRQTKSRSQSEFDWGRCRFVGHVDHNAAIVIAARGAERWGEVTRPHAAPTPTAS